MPRTRIIIAATFASLFATTAVGVAIFLHFCPHYIMFRSCSPMLNAVLANDAAEIRRLAAAGEPLETRFSTWDQSSFERDATPLLLAALRGHSEAAIALIELGADVNAFNEFDHSVCRILIEHDDDRALSVALDAGLDDATFGGKSEQLETMLLFCDMANAKRCEKMLGSLIQAAADSRKLSSLVGRVVVVVGEAEDSKSGPVLVHATINKIPVLAQVMVHFDDDRSASQWPAHLAGRKLHVFATLAHFEVLPPFDPRMPDQRTGNHSCSIEIDDLAAKIRVMSDEP